MPLLDVNTNLGSVAAAPGITEACGEVQMPRSQVELERVGSAGNKAADFRGPRTKSATSLKCLQRDMGKQQQQ